MIRFHLHGIHGVYNYGCEALVRTTGDILRARWPDSEVIYLSRRPSADRAALSDCPVSVVDDTLPPRIHPRRIWRALRGSLGLPNEHVQIEKTAWITRTDCVLSIGGDLFTLGPGSYSSRTPLPQFALPRQVLNAGKPYVLWAASIGPFEAWPAAVSVYQRFLAELPLITVREASTRDYLNKLGIARNVVLTADPAFLLNPVVEPGDWPFPDQSAPVWGVNLSPLAALYAHGKHRWRAALPAQAEFLAHLIRKRGVRLLLVPHVIAPHVPLDDDFGYLEQLMGLLDPATRARVRLLPSNLGARRTKGVLSQCELVMAARMHCGVASVSTGTPCLFLSYSQKSVGMSTLLYGHPRFSVALNDLADSSATDDLIDEMLRSAGSLRSSMVAQCDRLRELAQANATALARVIDTHAN